MSGNRKQSSRIGNTKILQHNWIHTLLFPLALKPAYMIGLCLNKLFCNSHMKVTNVLMS